MAGENTDFLIYTIVLIIYSNVMLWLIYYIFIGIMLAIGKFKVKYISMQWALINFFIYACLLIHFCKNVNMYIILFTDDCFYMMMFLNYLTYTIFENYYIHTVGNKIKTKFSNYYFSSIYYGTLLHDYIQNCYTGIEDGLDNLSIDDWAELLDTFDYFIINFEEETKEHKYLTQMEFLKVFVYETKKENGTSEEMFDLDLEDPAVLLLELKKERKNKRCEIRKFIKKYYSPENKNTDFWNFMSEYKKNFDKEQQEKKKKFEAKVDALRKKYPFRFRPLEITDPTASFLSKWWNSIKIDFYDTFLDSRNEDFKNSKYEFITWLRNTKKDFIHPVEDSAFYKNYNSWNYFFSKIAYILCFLWISRLLAEFIILYVYPTGFTFSDLYIKIFEQPINYIELKFHIIFFMVNLKKLSRFFFSFKTERYNIDHYIAILVDLIVNFSYLLFFCIRTILFSCKNFLRLVYKILTFFVFYIPGKLIDGTINIIKYIYIVICLIIDFIKKYFGL